MTPQDLIKRARNGRKNALQSLQAREGNLLFMAHFRSEIRGENRKDRPQAVFASTRTVQPTRIAARAFA